MTIDAKRIAEIRELANNLCDAVAGGALAHYLVHLDKRLADSCGPRDLIALCDLAERALLTEAKDQAAFEIATHANPKHERRG